MCDVREARGTGWTPVPNAPETSTSNMMHEWSVLAFSRPARKHADSRKTSDGAHGTEGGLVHAREAVTNRNVERGALIGSKRAMPGELSSQSWMIQSPPEFCGGGGAAGRRVRGQRRS